MDTTKTTWIVGALVLFALLALMFYLVLAATAKGDDSGSGK